MRFRPFIRFLLLAALGVVPRRGARLPGRCDPDQDAAGRPRAFRRTGRAHRGQVGLSAGVLGYGAYQVDDGTGTLSVVSQGGGAPREGAQVGVEGTFKAVFTLGTQSVAVLLEKQRFTP